MFRDQPAKCAVRQRGAAAELPVFDRGHRARWRTASVIAVDPQGIAAAISAEPQIRVSESAAVHEEDTTPLPLSATGTPATVAAAAAGVVSNQRLVDAHRCARRLGRENRLGERDHRRLW